MDSPCTVGCSRQEMGCLTDMKSGILDIGHTVAVERRSSAQPILSTMNKSYTIYTLAMSLCLRMCIMFEFFCLSSL